MLKRSRKSRQRRTEQKKRQEQILSVQEEVESAAAEKKIDDYYQLLKERDVVFFLSDRVQTVLGGDFVLRHWLETVDGDIGIGHERSVGKSVDLLDELNYIEDNLTVVVVDDAYEHFGDVNRLHREFSGPCILLIAPTCVLHNEIDNNPVAQLQYLYLLACAA